MTAASYLINSYSEKQVARAVDKADLTFEDKNRLFAYLAADPDHVWTQENMTPLYNLDQINAAMIEDGLGEKTRIDILTMIQNAGPHTTMMSSGFAETLGVVQDTFKIEDFRRACLDLEMDPFWDKRFIDKIRDIREERVHVRRVKVSEINFNDAGKKIRFASATIPRWQVFTDMKPLHGTRDYILVLDGKVVVSNDVPIDIDDRKPTSD